MAKGTRGRPPGPRTLSSVSLEMLQAELRRRQSAVKPLLRKRAALASKIAAIDAQLGLLGQVASAGAPAQRKGPGRRGPRAKNAMGLVQVLQKVMSGKPLGVADAAKAALAAGYKTNSGNFRTVVNQTLLVNKDKFKKVSRGLYTTK